MTPKFKATVFNQVLKLENPEGYKTWVKSLEGKQVSVVISEWKNTRSSNQNNYYWGIIVQLLCDHTGYTAQEMHEALKVKFLLQPKIVKEVSLPTVKSTALLNTKEFEGYCTAIREWASAELDCFIPLPNDCVMV